MRLFGSTKSSSTTDRRSRRYSYYLKQYQPEGYEVEKASCKGILKKKTLEESLQSCKNPYSKSPRGRRTSLLSLRTSAGSSLSGGSRTSMYNLFSKSVKRGQAPILNDASSTAAAEISASQNPKKVSFANIEARVYHVAPDDNPSVSGNGPAIALSGWDYEKEPALSLEDYEASHPPDRRSSTQKVKDLKITVEERKRLLMEAGASRKELQDFTKRVKKAKIKRAEAIEELKVHGKQHEEVLARNESRQHAVQKILGFRRTGTVEQVALWKNANVNRTSRAQRASA